MDEENGGLIPKKDAIIERILDDAHDDSALSDFQMVRSNLHTLIGHGETAVEELVDLAKRSGHPQVYAVLAKFIDTMVEANKAILDEQAKLRTLKDLSVRHVKEINPTHQTAIFVGSTAQFQKAVGKLMKNIDNDKED